MPPPAPTPAKKKRGTKHERAWHGPVIFSFGFRPFFLFAAIFSVLSMALWLSYLQGYSDINTALSPTDWHMHEMLFGYASAVIAGFLFTAVPNWTGRFPVAGWPLIGIFAVWVAGRLAMLWGAHLPFGWAAIIDIAFLPLLGAVIAREIISGKNWRNIKVLVPVFVLFAANTWFHIENLAGNSVAPATRLGFSAILFLISLIGGRIIPSFTRNWLSKQGDGPLPTPFNRFDIFVVALTAVSLLAWTFKPEISHPALGITGLLHLIRLSRWTPLRTLPNPLLFVLHLFYLCIPLGFLTMAAAIWLEDPTLDTAALHIFGIGAVAGVTLAVMVRASLGHTGRTLTSSPPLTAIFILIAISLVLRVTGSVWIQADWAITAAGLFWIAAFSVFCTTVGLWLIAPRQSQSPD